MIVMELTQDFSGSPAYCLLAENESACLDKEGADSFERKMKTPKVEAGCWFRESDFPSCQPVSVFFLFAGAIRGAGTAGCGQLESGRQ